jgi:hypothetical protein
MRLRLLDWNTPWFWLTVFWQRGYGKPLFELSVWKPNAWQRWWLHLYQWEEIRPNLPIEAVASSSGEASE